MNTTLLISGILVFFAAFVAVESTLNWWRSNRSANARRLDRRLSMIGGASEAGADQSILKRRVRVATEGARSIEQRLISRADLLLVQSGSELTPRQLLTLTLLWAVAGGLLSLVFRLPAGIVVLAAAGAGSIPWIRLMIQRASRLRRFESLMPDALDLIGRALRSGHSFPSALRLAGDELPEPVGGELRATSDEIALGSSQAAALQHLARRVPIQDLSFFVIAVVIQRETGGNLAEVLDNIARIIRDRLKLFGKVRSLSAEANMSAWVLALLPVATAGMLLLVNPAFISQLWTEPLGLKMIYFGVASTLVGIVWMRKIIRIHV